MNKKINIIIVGVTFVVSSFIISNYHLNLDEELRESLQVELNELNIEDILYVESERTSLPANYLLYTDEEVTYTADGKQLEYPDKELLNQLLNFTSTIKLGEESDPMVINSILSVDIRYRLGEEVKTLTIFYTFKNSENEYDQVSFYHGNYEGIKHYNILLDDEDLKFLRKLNEQGILVEGENISIIY